MVKEVSKEEWISITKNSARHSIFTDPDFLEPVANVFNCSLKYFIAYLKDKPSLGFAFFIRGNRIEVPTHFIYSGIWWDVKYHTIKFRDLLISMISTLKSKYLSIEIRLPPEIDDIRPFQWANFSYRVNYTYIRNTQEADFEYNIKSRVRKAAESGIHSSQSIVFEQVWKHQLLDLKRFYFSDRVLKKIKRMFSDWEKNGFMLIYESRREGNIIGSSCILYDKYQSKALNLLISSANSNYHLGVHAALYNCIFADLRHKEIKSFDLYGADIRGVADFKASFGAVLTPHYTVRYNKYLSAFKIFIGRLRGNAVAIKSRLF